MGSRFEGANFTAADLSNAKLNRRTTSRGAHFERANISGADFRDAEGLTQTQLNRACGDTQTRLPRGLRVRGNCGQASASTCSVPA